MPAPGPRTTYQYSRDFEATAAHLSQLPGLQCATWLSRFISFWLLFGSSGITQLIYKFRYAGTQGAP